MMANDVPLRLLDACHTLTASPAISSTPPWWWSAIVAPASTAAFALAAAWIAIAFERRKTVNQELIKKRITIYDDLAPKLNALYCFFLRVGDWKEFTPEEMLRHKRHLDHSFHIYAPLVSRALARAYHEFIDACFETFTGSGKPARLRANADQIRSNWGAAWRPEWSDRIAPADLTTDRRTVNSLYLALMEQFAIEIGVRQQPQFVRWRQRKTDLTTVDARSL